MELQKTITRENIETLVTLFYHGAMKDDQIGEYFILELGEDITNDEWARHIDILVDFWAKVFLDDPLYNSDPYGPHFTIVGLKKEDFTRWVELFSKAAHEVYTPQIAQLFEEKGVTYAQEFIERLKINPSCEQLFWV